MRILFTTGRYDIVPSVQGEEALVLLHRGNVVCDITQACAEKLQWLFQKMQSPLFANYVSEEVNCHGLAEYVQGRSLKWRNKPKTIGSEIVVPHAPLPEELPLTYQFLSHDHSPIHSGIVLGRASASNDAYILDKLNGGQMSIETYRENIRDWTRLICPVQEVRLRRAAAGQQPLRKAA